MLKILNEEGDSFLAKIKLRRDLRDAILKQIPIKRLKLSQSEKKISNKTYEKLFIELYNRVKKSQSEHYENLSFFDR
ncbi:hypothetical protein ELD05_07855 [Caldicellulosiruptor changbaiensis]|uniref:Uncharacterized protein n=1 Tax=Caldicellulosiruptor changbaiensis TaxID=1222016 RepID=A0A3T0D672_9FIRM|nr:hypothetical protein [Caldicellulosiruptor changbaiensis]AZT90567.1 hypothetical protein ELD05_07855 [Caldicellulosiruptor changbaiensis]